MTLHVNTKMMTALLVLRSGTNYAIQSNRISSPNKSQRYQANNLLNHDAHVFITM